MIPLKAISWICLCPDGSYVSRDMNNNCNFQDCPITVKPTIPVPPIIVHPPIGAIPPMLPPSPMPLTKPFPILPKCCDPLTRPDGTNGNPLCFEGSACCPDGNWACSVGDGRTFSCGGQFINTMINPQAFGAICTTSQTCPANQCLDPYGNCRGSVLCFANPCDVNKCAAASTCEANYCGGCHAIFKDANGNIIDPANCNGNAVGCGIDHCTSYNDGCNICGCRINGFPICSMRACLMHEITQPFCTGCESGYILNPTTKKCEACMCPMVNEPVCCGDGKTYSNSCQAACQKASNCAPGMCAIPPMANPTPIITLCPCPKILDPVCCTDGVTYSNLCQATCEGATGCSQGRCPSISPVSITIPCGGFINCANYNDGCNDCVCRPSGINVCTEKACFVKGTPKCIKCNVGYTLNGNRCI